MLIDWLNSMFVPGVVSFKMMDNTQKYISSPIIAKGNKYYVKLLGWFALSVILFFALVAVFYNGIRGVGVVGWLGYISLLLLISVALYGGYSFEIRIYSDRIERVHFRRTVVYFDDIRRIHCSGWSGEKAQVYTEGDVILPTLTIMQALEDWEMLVAMLLTLVPEEVEVTGSEKLVASLRKIQQQLDL